MSKISISKDELEQLRFMTRVFRNALEGKGDPITPEQYSWEMLQWVEHKLEQLRKKEILEKEEEE
jgi:hypothetical protein